MRTSVIFGKSTEFLFHAWFIITHRRDYGLLPAYTKYLVFYACAMDTFPILLLLWTHLSIFYACNTDTSAKFLCLCHRRICKISKLVPSLKFLSLCHGQISQFSMLVTRTRLQNFYACAIDKSLNFLCLWHRRICKISELVPSLNFLCLYHGHISQFSMLVPWTHLSIFYACAMDTSLNLLRLCHGHISKFAMLVPWIHLPI